VSAGEAWHLLADSYSRWSADRASRIAAALSFSITFAAAPLLIVGMTIAGWVLEGESVRAAVIGEVRAVLGLEAAEFVAAVLTGTSEAIGRSGALPPALALLVSFFGASNVVGALRAALNDIWGVRRHPRSGLVHSLLGTIGERLFYLATALSIGLLIIVSLALNTGLAAAIRYSVYFLPANEWALSVGNYLLSFLITTAVFAVMFKIIPDVVMAWKDALVGAAVTSILFTFGQFAISLYLARSSAASVYGAAGSIVVILLWVYYSMQVFLYGAEFTQVYSDKRGAGIRPSSNAYAVRYDRLPRLDAEVAESDSQDSPAQV